MCLLRPALIFGAGFFYLCLWFHAPQVRGDQWESGDIVMRHGTGLWSEFFRIHSVRDPRFSHVGVVWVENGEVYCIHSEGDDLSGRGAVQMVTLRQFFKPSRGNGHFRLRLPAEVRMHFAREVRKLIGVPFDWRFNTDDHSALYCTELVEVALKEAAPQIKLRRSSTLIPIDALTDPEIVEELSAALP